MWYYKEKQFKSEDIKEYYGFVYEITETSTGKKYIGKKKFKSKITKPPLKGKKRKRITYKESDWQDYYGSSDQVNQILLEKGSSNFERNILKLCNSSGEMSYYEAKFQFEKDVLLKPNEYYNAFIGCKIHRKHVFKENN
jgi:hypothetical protein